MIGDRLFFVSDWGIATWLDALRGEDVWRQRLGGRHYASPIAAGERIYTWSVEGETRVIAAHDEFRELAKNQLDGEIRASPAVVGDAFLVRTDLHLYRIEEPSMAEDAGREAALGAMRVPEQEPLQGRLLRDRSWS